jgi:hypothetical protein
MGSSVLNAVLCERILGAERYSLINVGLRWPWPPSTLGVWIELTNLSEQPFTVSEQIWRGREFLDQSEEELVLEGKSYWQSRFMFEGTQVLERKSYSFVVLLNGVPCHTIVADFGAVEST